MLVERRHNHGMNQALNMTNTMRKNVSPVNK